MIRVLVVEDHRGFRAFITSTLKAESELEVIGEMSDGLSAVTSAGEFSPDLILMDVGLPKLNGIEAARQIRQVSPNSKILFLSALVSPDIVRAALETDASGYVLKSDAGSELLAAVKAVSRGERFVSGRLKALISSDPISDLPVPTKALSIGNHKVQFYSEEMVFRQSVSEFIGSALRTGNAAILFATKPHRDAVFQELHSQGLDVSAAIQRGVYVVLDAAEVLATFMVEGWPDEDRFMEAFRRVVESATKASRAPHSRVAVFGEAVALLWAEGKAEAALRLEQLGNQLTRTFGVDILCAYPFSLDIQDDDRAFKAICAEHSAVCTR